MSMLLKKVIKWYGSQSEMSRRMGVDRAAVSAWVSSGALPPLRAIQVERQSGGKFKAIDLVLKKTK